MRWGSGPCAARACPGVGWPCKVQQSDGAGPEGRSAAGRCLHARVCVRACACRHARTRTHEQQPLLATGRGPGPLTPPCLTEGKVVALPGEVYSLQHKQ